MVLHMFLTFMASTVEGNVVVINPGISHFLEYALHPLSGVQSKVEC